MRQLIAHEDAEPVTEQPTKPCSDCPWARAALPGWLGDMTPEEWIKIAHGENLVECHALKPAGALRRVECAGLAVYRANVCKLVRPVPGASTPLTLPADRVRVFARPTEFLEHHKKGFR